MMKTEAPVKKVEAKEEGAKPNHKRVVYSDKRKKYTIIGVSLAALCLLIIIGLIVYNASVQPRFILNDLSVDSITNSSLVVKLSSNNPSSLSSVYYSKIGMRVWVEGNFETERVFLADTFQKPHSVLMWTAPVATNSKNARISGSFQLRDGVTNGKVITEFFIQWKNGFFSSAKYSLRVTCPVLLNLKDLTSVVSKPMSPCSRHYTS